MLTDGYIAISFLDVLDMVRANWRKLAAAGFTGVLLGVLVSLVMKPSFTSSATLLTSTETTGMSGLSAAALFAKANTSTPELDLFRSLLVSREVLQDFLRAEIQVGDSAAPVWQWHEVDTTNRKKVYAKILDLRSMVSAKLDEKSMSGLLTVEFSASSSQLAQACLTELLAISLNRMAQARKARWDMQEASLDSAATIASEDWRSAYKNLVSFDEANRSTILPRDKERRAGLDLELRIVEQRILQARNSLEQVKLERQKSSAPAVVIEAPDAPPFKTKPKRLLIVLAFGLMGTLGMFVRQFFVLLLRNGWLQRRATAEATAT